MNAADRYSDKMRGHVPSLDVYKDFYFPIVGNNTFATGDQQIIPRMAVDATNFREYFSPYHNVRPAIDHGFWKEAILEMEDPILPFRIKAQQVYNASINNGDVFSCMTKRMNLTLLKEYHICDENGKTNEEATKLIQKPWFREGLRHILEAQFFGYSLIEFGSLVNGDFPDLSITRRGWISPDRKEFSSTPAVPGGVPFLDPKFKDSKGRSFYDFSLWVPTASDIGISRCGYGLLYKVAMYEIILRNILGWNSDYVEVYGQPLRHAKSIKKQGSAEYNLLERAMREMGSAAYLITDPQDDITLKEPTAGGTGWKSYADFETRNKKVISMLLLGHGDAMNSIPGKLGSSQKAGAQEDSPVQKALNECEATDGRMAGEVVNMSWIPKLQKFGFDIPLGHKFELKNDLEKQETASKENKSFQDVATFVLALTQAGYTVDPAWITKRTGIPLEKAEEMVPPPVPGGNKPEPGKKPFPKHIENRLEKLYNHGH